eukprot:CAMPEP_0174842734 /NCGR_PEP_ID=MMETSP1114-20130205/10094_1 /TAXON_ID=312471 /ORGANISM="Neobodo designis, Strain CCAP 1951/1" /LENGTH=34 /DNA_ID= /DNA_START= /DNA_END= /DNA_ORIENTATION=
MSASMSNRAIDSASATACASIRSTPARKPSTVSR